MFRHASVNRIYRLVWSHASSSWVPASETARGRGKGSCKTLLAATLSLAAGLATAGPIGGQVVTGSGQIAQSGALTTITQASPTLALSWASFNIAPQETVNFVQPSVSAIAVNRITGTNGTQILGHLNANGQVYLINPNGIVFGRGAQVNVGGLVASTLDLDDASLGSDTRTFSGTGAGRIVNAGTITATGDGSGGGYVALLGNHVTNQGVISAQLGTVASGAGSAVTLTFNGNTLVHLQVDRSVLNSVAENGGLMRADGGQVLMSAGAKDALLASVVNNTGVIEARTVQEHEGTITLLGGMAAGTVNLAGTLDASAPGGGDGGFIETSAAHVKIADSAQVTTAAASGLNGSWLIDPQDFTVAASGGDTTGAQLSASLANNNMIVQSSAGATAGNGDVNINDAVAWNANTLLTLTASNDVNINASLTATGHTAGLVIAPNTPNGSDAASGTGTYTLANGAAINLPGSNPTLSIAGIGYTVINQLGAAADAGTAPGTPSLQGMAAAPNLSGHYALGSNLDASPTVNWNGGAGFTPIGTLGAHFEGTLDGLGHSVSNLFINLPLTRSVGLFGFADYGSTLQNVGLIGANVTGSIYVGALLGDDSGATIRNSYATGAVTGVVSGGGYSAVVGGLVGRSAGAISDSYAAVSVSGAGGSVGGLVGWSVGSISNSYATGSANGSDYVGGLVGSNSGTIVNSHASGGASGNTSIGGLVGSNYGSIDNSYATGTVTGSSYVGGLTGVNRNTISNSYAIGSASGDIDVGGLVGLNYGSIDITYATGRVSGSSYVGGSVGRNPDNTTITHSYWNTTTSGQATSAQSDGALPGTGGLTTLQMQHASSFGGFNFSTTPGATGNSWVVVDFNGTFNNESNSTGATFPILTSEYSTTVSNAHQLQLMSLDLSASYTLAGNIDASATARAAADGSSDVWSTGGFAPIGTWGNPFAGSFDGLGHTIAALTLDWPTLDAVGLFGNVDTASTVQNVGLIGGSVTGHGYVGGLAGMNNGSIRNSYATGTVNGVNAYVGGLVGINYGAIDDSYATGAVTGNQLVGGLAGHNYRGSISSSYATGAVAGNSYLGGLVGTNGASIANSYATGSVSGNSIVGGLAGTNPGHIDNAYATGTVTGSLGVGGLVGISQGSIANAYASGTVTGSSYVGGLVGANIGGIANAYATGNVSGDEYVGGLVGYHVAPATIRRSYSTGLVTGISNVGGLVGSGTYGITDSYWNTDTSGQASSGSTSGVIGLSTLDMHSTASFAGFAFSTVPGAGGNSWVMVDADGTLNNAGGVTGATFPMLTSEYSTVISNGHQLQLMTMDLGASYTLAVHIDASGTAVAVANGNGDVWSTAGGFVPIGSSASPFTGSFNGQGRTIANLTLNRPTTDHVGLFGVVANGATIQNVGLVGGNVSGQNFVGALAGETWGTISNSYATATVTGGSDVGGLVGTNQGSVSDAYATGAVIGNSSVGGLVGTNHGLIANAYTTGTVSGDQTIGGLVGYNANDGSVSNAYATGNMSGDQNVGGLAGYNENGGTVNNAYATGNVSGNDNVGGLVGSSDGSIRSAYSTGLVTGSSNVGGLVGSSAGGVTDSYWNMDTSGQTSGGRGSAGTGLSTLQMQTVSNFSGFAFSTVPGAGGNSWVMVDADGTLNNAGGVTGATFPMLTSEYSTVIANAHQLQLTLMDLGARYTLAANIDASATAVAVTNGVGDVWSTAGGFVPIGSRVSAFTGSFDGQGRTIGNLTINRPATDYVGLFGYAADAATIQNVGLVDGSVSGKDYVGGLAGATWGTISNSYNTGSVSGYGFVGGLVGWGGYGAISNSYATGNVTGNSGVGGLMGATRGAISNSYATGNVVGSYAGGLVGVNVGSMSNSYATGSVTGSDYVGGLVGRNIASIDTSYSTGVVGGTGSEVGGLIGGNQGKVTNSFWNTTTNGDLAGVGDGDDSGITGLTSAGMMMTSNFTAVSWSISGSDGGSTWRIYAGNTAPLLSSFLTPLTVIAVDDSVVFNGGPFTGGNGVIYSATPKGNLLGTLAYGGSSQGAIAAGGYAITPGGLYSNQQGYSIAFAIGTLTINRLALTGTISTGSSVYGASLAPGSVTFTNLVSGYTAVTATDTVTIDTAGNLSGSGNLKAGSYTGIETVEGALGGTDAGNYSFAGLTGDYAVSKLALAGSIAAGSSIYGATLTPGAVSFSNAVAYDVLGTATVNVITGGQTSTGGNLTAGTHTGVEAVSALSGADAANYTFAGVTGDYAVNKLALAGSIAAGSSVYGATLAPGAASFSNAVAYDVLGTATVNVNTTGQTSSSGNLTAGTHTGVEAVSALSGADAGNYTFAGLTGDYAVNKLALAGSITAGSSVYGATLAPGAASFSNAVVNDVLGTATVNLVTTGQTSTSGNLTAGTHTGVEAVSALSGADAGNYTFAGTTGDYNVTKLALTGSIAAGSSIYGATLAPGAATITNAILGDVVTADTPTVSITNHTSTSGNLTAGTHLGIEVVGSALSGTDSGNYTFTGATGNYTVSPLAISVAAAGLNKVYDGTTSSSPTLTGSALILGDQIIISATAADFASKNAGIAQPITVSGISIGGADAANYALNNASATTTAMISTATLTVSGLAASNKTYDGNTTATLAGGSLVGVMAGDADFVTLTDAGSFASKNAGTGIAVTAADTLSGAGADNYVLVQPTGLLANITPATLTYNATPTTRTAGQTPTGLNGSLSGFVAADTQANDTIGTPAWTTTAGAGSLDGQYPIDGDGLTAANYVFIQATGNAGALTLQPAAAPPPIPVPPPVATVPALPPAALSAIAQLQATGLASFADARREALTVPLTLAAPPGAAGDGGTGAVDSGGSADGESMASASGQDTVTSDERPIIETHRTIDLMGASLRVVNGGVRLPN